jgi:hypothetical protein
MELMERFHLAQGGGKRLLFVKTATTLQISHNARTILTSKGPIAISKETAQWR